MNRNCPDWGVRTVGRLAGGVFLVCFVGFFGVECVAASPAPTAPYRPPAKVPETGSGFRGDGTGVFPDCKPPIEWDEATGPSSASDKGTADKSPEASMRPGKNILWKAPVPNWCLGCPVPVGNRVFVMSEPSWQAGSVWPELICYDADTGAQVWRQVVDPFLAFPDLAADQRRKMTDEVAWSHGLYRAAYLASAPIAAKGGAGADSPEIKKANEALASLGMRIEQVRMNYGQLRSLRFSAEIESKFKEMDRRLKSYGVIRYNTWDNNQRCRVGLAFPTPVSDGERVYAMTAHGTVACYGMDGNLLWRKWSGRSVSGTHALMESPRLFGDLLLTQFKGNYSDAPKGAIRLFAWDKKTGEKRWHLDLPDDAKVKDNPWGSRGGASPTVMRIGKTPVVLSSSGNVIRLPDGKVYEAKIGPCLGTWAVDDEKDAIFSGGSHDQGAPRFGLDLAMEGESLTAKVRYVLPKCSVGDTPSSLFVAGRLFWPQAQLDPVAGLPLGANVADARKAPRSSPATRHLLLAANGHVYGLREEKPKGATKCQGICEVFTLDGKKAASNVLLAKERSDTEMNEKWLGQGFEKSSFSYGCPFAICGDRIYIRSEDYLYCIGVR